MNYFRSKGVFTCLLCGYLGMSEAETQEIHIAGHLYDMGKIGIPDRVLLKAGRLRLSLGFKMPVESRCSEEISVTEEKWQI